MTRGYSKNTNSKNVWQIHVVANNVRMAVIVIVNIILVQCFNNAGNAIHGGATSNRVIRTIYEFVSKTHQNWKIIFVRPNI